MKCGYYMSYHLKESSQVFAIGEAAREMKNFGYKNKNIKIHVDSPAAMRAVNSYLVKSNLICNTKDSLNRLCEENSVEITCMPAHLGNEFADILAKKEGDQIESVPFSNNVFYKAISD